MPALTPHERVFLKTVSAKPGGIGDWLVRDNEKMRRAWTKFWKAGFVVSYRKGREHWIRITVAGKAVLDRGSYGEAENMPAEFAEP